MKLKKLLLKLMSENCWPSCSGPNGFWHLHCGNGTWLPYAHNGNSSANKAKVVELGFEIEFATHPLDVCNHLYDMGGWAHSIFIIVTSQWAPWRLKSSASRVFASPCVQAHITKKDQNSASLTFVGGNHRWPVDSHHKGPVTREMFPFDDVIMSRNMTKISTFFGIIFQNIHNKRTKVRPWDRNMFDFR